MRTYEIKIIDTDGFSTYGSALVQADNFSDAVDIVFESGLLSIPTGHVVFIFVTNTATGLGIKLEAGM